MLLELLVKSGFVGVNETEPEAELSDVRMLLIVVFARPVELV